MATYLDELVQKIVTKADLKGFDDLERKQKRAIKSNDLLAKSFRRAFGIFFGIQGVRSVIKTTREIDLLQRSIQGLTGTADDWQYLRREAYRTGTDLTKAAQAYKNFYSAANMAGFQKPQIQSMFSDVLVAGRGIGANQQQIGAALLALEQMLSKGKVSMEELRRQMGNALPGSFEIAAKSMGVTTQEFNKLLEAGLDANEFVPRFTAMLKQELGKGFEANIKSLDFALVNLNTAWMEFQANILQGEAGEALAQLVRDITKILRSQGLLQFIKLISKGLAVIIKNIRLIITLFGIKVIFNTIRALKALHWAILDIATSTGVASAATEALAMSYAMMTSGQILSGIKLLSKALWAMSLPLLKLSTVLAGVVSWFLILQDLWLTFTDKDADTMTRRFMDAQKTKQNLAINTIKPLTSEEKDIAVKSLRAQGKQPFFKQNKEGLWELQEIKDDFIPNTTISAPSGGLFNSNSSSTNGQTNNLTINITAPNSQPEVIAANVEDVLQKFFTKYEMGYA